MLTEGLNRVLLVRGSGTEVGTTGSHGVQCTYCILIEYIVYLLCALYAYCIHCILMYLVLRVASFMATFQFNFFFP